MADEAKKEDNIDYLKKLEELSSNVKSGFEDVNNRLETSNKVNGSKPDEEEDDEEDEFMDDDKKIKVEVSKAKEELKREFRDDINKTKQYERDCNVWDQKAIKNFPMLNDSNSEFTRLVDKELKNDYPMAYDEMRKPIYAPNAVYNAAARVAAENPEMVKKPPMEELEGGGNFKRSVKGRDINDIQKELANFWGTGTKLNMKRLEENARAYNSRKLI